MGKIISNQSIKSNKKILIFSIAYIPFVGGAELAVKEITNRINSKSSNGAAGFQFDMITLRFDKNWPKFERVGNVNVHRISSPKLLFPFVAFLKALKLNKKNKYCLVWSIMANRAGYAALFFKMTHPKVKYLLTLQEGDAIDYPEERAGFLWLFVGSFFKRIFTKADCVQVISNYLAEWAKMMGVKAPIILAPNGISADEPIKPNAHKVKSLDEKKIIITTSRLVYKNGIDILIEAIAELKKDGVKNIQCQILGAGKEEEKLKELTRILGLFDEVVFLGHIDPEVIPNYLANADIFTRPSRSEGLGSSFLEAMSAGLPVIGTAVGGIPDFLKDPTEVGLEKATGLFCEVDNPKDLAEKIRMLLEDENLSKKIAQNGRDLVTKDFSWNTVANKMADIFNNLCGINFPQNLF